MEFPLEPRLDTERKRQLNILKVGTKSDPNKVAGALAGTVREQGKAEMWKRSSRMPSRARRSTLGVGDGLAGLP